MSRDVRVVAASPRDQWTIVATGTETLIVRIRGLLASLAFPECRRQFPTSPAARSPLADLSAWWSTHRVLDAGIAERTHDRAPSRGYSSRGSRGRSPVVPRGDDLRQGGALIGLPQPPVTACSKSSIRSCSARSWRRRPRMGCRAWGDERCRRQPNTHQGTALGSTADSDARRNKAGPS